MSFHGSLMSRVSLSNSCRSTAHTKPSLQTHISKAAHFLHLFPTKSSISHWSSHTFFFFSSPVLAWIKLLLNSWAAKLLVFFAGPSCLSSDCCNRNIRNWWLMCQKPISDSCEGWEVQDQGGDWFSPWFPEGSPIAVSSHGREVWKQNTSHLQSVHFSFIRTLTPWCRLHPHDPILTFSSPKDPHHHRQIPSHGIMVSHYALVGDTFSLQHCSGFSFHWLREACRGS